MTVPVLDASALLAHLHDEPGADVVGEAIAKGAAVSTVNIAEVLSSEANRGTNPVKLAEELGSRGLLDGALTVYPFTIADAIEASRLRTLTQAAGLSLGDRACLALTSRLDGVAVTADIAWARVKLDVELTLIREDSREHPFV